MVGWLRGAPIYAPLGLTLQWNSPTRADHGRRSFPCLKRDEAVAGSGAPSRPTYGRRGQIDFSSHTGRGHVADRGSGWQLTKAGARDGPRSTMSSSWYTQGQVDNVVVIRPTHGSVDEWHANYGSNIPARFTTCSIAARPLSFEIWLLSPTRAPSNGQARAKSGNSGGPQHSKAPARPTGSACYMLTNRPTATRTEAGEPMASFSVISAIDDVINRPGILDAKSPRHALRHAGALRTRELGLSPILGQGVVALRAKPGLRALGKR